jgi:hypothetical protein
MWPIPRRRRLLRAGATHQRRPGLAIERQLRHDNGIACPDPAHAFVGDGRAIEPATEKVSTMSGMEASPKEGRLMTTLERLLELPAADLRQSLNQASELLASALDADKIDIFLFDPGRKTLRALGTSNTPLGRLQRSLGLDVHPVANGGSIADVFKTGDPHITGHADLVSGVLPGVVN